MTKHIDKMQAKSMRRWIGAMETRQCLIKHPLGVLQLITR